ncbi:hypothetical protein [Caballeronia ptereochthonis]|uniref:hypothetical protein n=1 Tax=Caballeronia ptereochthonis TaxID=1777144 RepID=UPI00135C1A8F|nr:hypothetical protein [Caballeronia ptereochthonis]
MKKNAKQIERAGGLCAAIRSTGNESPSHSSIDPDLHERRLRLIEGRDVITSHRF